MKQTMTKIGTMGLAGLLAGAPAVADEPAVPSGVHVVATEFEVGGEKLYAYAKIDIADAVVDRRVATPNSDPSYAVSLDYTIDLSLRTEDNREFPVTGFNLDVYMTPASTFGSTADDMRVNMEAQGTEGRLRSRRGEGDGYLAEVHGTFSDATTHPDGTTTYNDQRRVISTVDLAVDLGQLFDRMVAKGYQLEGEGKKGKAYIEGGDFVFYTQGTIFALVGNTEVPVKVAPLVAGKVNVSYDTVKILNPGAAELYPTLAADFRELNLIVTKGRRGGIFGLNGLFGTGFGRRGRFVVDDGVGFQNFGNHNYKIVGMDGWETLLEDNDLEEGDVRVRYELRGVDGLRANRDADEESTRVRVAPTYVGTDVVRVAEEGRVKLKYRSADGHGRNSDEIDGSRITTYDPVTGIVRNIPVENGVADSAPVQHLGTANRTDGDYTLAAILEIREPTSSVTSGVPSGREWMEITETPYANQISQPKTPWIWPVVGGVLLGAGAAGLTCYVTDCLGGGDGYTIIPPVGDNNSAGGLTGSGNNTQRLGLRFK